MEYSIVNPIMLGKIDWGKITANSPIDAAKKFWDEFSKHITGEIPKFVISLKDAANNLLHFEVSERTAQTGGGNATMADYMISSFHKVNKDAERKMLKNYNYMMQKIQNGGKHDSSSSSSSSSTSDVDKMIRKYQKVNAARRTSQIAYYFYNP